MPIIPVLRRLSLEDCQFKARLGYIVRPVSKNKKNHRASSAFAKLGTQARWGK
jgi:hypothetical protein